MVEQHVESLADETVEPDSTGAESTEFLTLGHVLAGIGADRVPPIRLEDIHIVRHSFKPGVYDAAHVFGPEDPLQGPEDLGPQRVVEYTRSQDISTKRFPADPGSHWVILIADGKRRSRLYGTFENCGEVLPERTATRRYWDLRPCNFLAPLVGRLVVEWDNPRTWQRRATNVANLPVLEIADRDKVSFPGFDRVLLTHHELCEMVDDHRYADWRVALSEVQGIYLITDSSNGKQYVGKADGAERILQRWTSYARDGHGGNIALRDLAFASVGSTRVRTDHARHFVFSILRVFGPSTSSSEVDAAEAHYKRTLMTREFGLNRN